MVGFLNCARAGFLWRSAVNTGSFCVPCFSLCLSSFFLPFLLSSSCFWERAERRLVHFSWTGYIKGSEFYWYQSQLWQKQPLGRLLLGLSFSLLEDDAVGRAGSHLVRSCREAVAEMWKPNSCDSDLNLFRNACLHTQLVCTGEAIMLVRSLKYCPKPLCPFAVATLGLPLRCSLPF